jgi:hypothetical protein
MNSVSSRVNFSALLALDIFVKNRPNLSEAEQLTKAYGWIKKIIKPKK